VDDEPPPDDEPAATATIATTPAAIPPMANGLRPVEAPSPASPEATTSSTCPVSWLSVASAAIETDAIAGKRINANSKTTTQILALRPLDIDFTVYPPETNLLFKTPCGNPFKNGHGYFF
jgi:hypothetical protein